ncbi:hypothetical protein AG1IA_02096 [Rhizoctonia solani AG-1 IA]|uniref:Uncharacterized protein n=1 Tax=Thanatephorus cucumeris (strain AG1-IA) TaxID=983506 RepID=L8X0Y0_THACA|nr:hypothetical protein AG1IA_02096 [Rhizoctonia solani AG-1 IA]
MNTCLNDISKLLATSVVGGVEYRVLKPRLVLSPAYSKAKEHPGVLAPLVGYPNTLQIL